MGTEQGKLNDITCLYQPIEITRPLLYGKTPSVVELPVETRLGTLGLREDIQSSDGPYPYLPEYQAAYPPNVVQAFVNLYAEYNQAFRPLVDSNREWQTDYQYCTAPDGSPVNRWVQIDMVGLPEEFLQTASSLSVDDITRLLRGRIFELENNLACYQETMFMFSKPGEPALFEREFRASLERARQQYGKPIALLAATEDKYLAMMQEELGKRPGDIVTDEEVMRLTGFDRLFSPAQFERYVADNDEVCDFLLYVRSSDPISKLRNPSLTVESPLLAQADMRRVIKQNALTFNVDNPAWVGADRIINDTKMYQPRMGMAFPIINVGQLGSPAFGAFLQAQGMSLEQLAAEQIYFRVKPAVRSYGCYGQDRGQITDPKFLRDLAKNMQQRGPYVVQPEMQIPLVIDERGREYAYMDRVYLTTDGQSYRFMGGCRYFMPVDSTEYRRGRIHGNSSAVLGEIVSR